MAHTKSGGSTSNLRDSQPKYLGVKLSAGQIARPGNVIIRQRGTKILPGEGVRVGHDHTLYAIKHGIIAFGNKRKTRYDGKVIVHKIVHVVAAA